MCEKFNTLRLIEQIRRVESCAVIFRRAVERGERVKANNALSCLFEALFELYQLQGEMMNTALLQLPMEDFDVKAFG